MKKLFELVNRTRWSMTPDAVNAYYTPSKNQIVFPAGMKILALLFCGNGEEEIISCLFHYRNIAKSIFQSGLSKKYKLWSYGCGNGSRTVTCF